MTRDDLDPRIGPAAMTTESDLLQAIESRPFDEDVRLVFADWLEEQGDPRAELIRIQHALRRIDVPDRAAVERRMHALLDAGVEPLVVTRKSAAGPLVAILPGEFLMGSKEDELERSESEKEQVRVTLTKGYWLGQTTVTQSQWRTVMGTTPWTGDSWIKKGPSFPATAVNWTDAMKYCRKLTEQEHAAGRISEHLEYRLPTEVEWGYACRSGTTSAYSFGDDALRLGEYAWWDGNTTGEQYAHAVGLKKPNPWGLFDIHGNVWEWCADAVTYLIEPLPYGRSAEDVYRVDRGGGCFSTAGSCRSACRSISPPYSRGFCGGFRVARGSVRPESQR